MFLHQLHPLFAARVSEIDLAKPPSPGEIRAIGEAIDRFAVVVFRDQHLDDDAQLAFARSFGPIEPPQVQRGPRRLKHAEMADVSNLDAEQRIRGADDRRRMNALGNRLWHADASYRDPPGALSMLYAHVVPPEGGETQFADMRAAYDALTPSTQAQIGNLVAEHSIFHSRGQIGFTDFNEAERAAMPPVQHPLVRVHPGSRRKSLYLGAHASHVVGMPLPDGRLLLRDLTEHATGREFVYTHHWRPGDLVIWDNRCTLHRGLPYDDVKHRRDLRRVTTQDLPGARDRAA